MLSKHKGFGSGKGMGEEEGGERDTKVLVKWSFANQVTNFKKSENREMQKLWELFGSVAQYWSRG